MVALPGFFFETVGSGIREQQREAAAKAERDQQYEREMLQILAQHGSDEIRGLAGTAWLDLAQNPNRPRSKGLAGFLGQTQASPYFKDVQTALQSARVAPAPQPPSAAMSSNAPVSPGSRPIAAPPTGQSPQIPPAPAAPAAGQPSSVGPAFGGALDPSGQLAAVGQGPEGPPMRGPAAPPEPIQARGMFPPPPEPPRHVSLFPTAEQLTRDKVNEANALAQGRYDAAAQAIQRYGGTPQQIQDAILGMSGAPRRRVNSLPMILTVNGQEVLGTYDPEFGTYEVDGVQVSPTSARRPPTSVPQGPKPQLRVGPNGEYQWIYPPEQEQPGVPPAPAPEMSVTTVPTGVNRPPPVAPPATSGTVTLGPGEPGVEPGVYERARGGGLGGRLGPAPKAAGQKTDEQRQYEVWLKQVDANITALGKNKLTGRVTVLTPQQRDAEVQKVTGIPGMTYNELALGAKGGTISPRGKSGLSRDEMAGMINDLAKQFGGSQTRTDVVEGGTTIPAAPPPPRR